MRATRSAASPARRARAQRLGRSRVFSLGNGCGDEARPSAAVPRHVFTGFMSGAAAYDEGRWHLHAALEALSEPRAAFLLVPSGFLAASVRFSFVWRTAYGPL